MTRSTAATLQRAEDTATMSGNAQRRRKGATNAAMLEEEEAGVEVR